MELIKTNKNNGLALFSMLYYPKNNPQCWIIWKPYNHKLA